MIIARFGSHLSHFFSFNLYSGLITFNKSIFSTHDWIGPGVSFGDITQR